MSKRKRPPRSARSRITRARPAPGPKRSAPAGTRAAGTGLWLYGVHAVAAALRNPERRRHRLIATRQALAALTDEPGSPETLTPAPEIVERTEIDAACGADAVHQGVGLLVDPLPNVAIEDAIAAAIRVPACVLVLDQATDPRNVGAVLRSARAFGAAAVIVQDRNAAPESGAMAKAASGALEAVPVVRVTNLARALWTLKDAGFWCLGLDGDADTVIGEVTPTDKTALVLGAEGTGLRRLTRETCDQLARIPIATEAESLNLSNAAAVALYAVTAKPG